MVVRTTLAMGGPWLLLRVSPTGQFLKRPSRSESPGGTILTFKLHHKFAEVWTLGRFRLSLTRGGKPIGLSLPEDFRAILATAPEVRTDVQKSLITNYLRAINRRNCARRPQPLLRARHLYR